MLVLGYLGIIAVLVIGVSHGSPQEIWSPEALVVAFGGAVVATVAGLSMQELRESLQALRVAFTIVTYDYERLIGDFIAYAGISRKDGLLGLEKVISQIDDPFLSRAVQMAIDGVEPDIVEERLAVELASMDERHARTRAT